MFHKVYMFFKILRDYKNIRLLKKSDLFDKNYYLTLNDSIRYPYIHYFYYGWKDGLSPSFSFSTKKYLERYDDVYKSKQNPLIHYLKYGKNENRIIEKDDLIFSIADFYQKIYNYPYSYSFYYCSSIKHINLFIDDVYDISEECISFILSFSDASIRIISNSLDYSKLKNCLSSVSQDISYISLKGNNYLECSPDDIFIAFSWKSIRALSHTNLLTDQIYYYLTKDEYLKNQDMISSILQDSRIVLLLDDSLLLNELTIMRTKIIHFNRIPKEKNLVYDFSYLNIYGLELLNDYLLQKKLMNQYSYIKVIYPLSFIFQLNGEVEVYCIHSNDFDDKLDATIEYSSTTEEYNHSYILL